ncbi:GNAT family N-acetyltransferase [Chryseobacterium sp.]|uniref:GNAT family N-acetyltransferase n=1 Tax=Chryseobacterium sp. TaxID=1871047 RepID=UPI00289BD27A|nr:GNAT family N-acetyltransferase [Chryseobacterium sp.]
MEFLQVTSPDDYRVGKIYNSYINSFPEDERRDWTKFVALFTHPKVKVFSVLHENNNSGYVVIWELSDFTFVEHFEVFNEYRNLKIGSQILDILKQNYPRIILEIEPEHLSEDAKRRFSFYQRNGFSLIDEMYLQPSYGDGKKKLELWLLANYKPLDLKLTIDEIHDIVYH